jgi:dihydrofolate reductase
MRKVVAHLIATLDGVVKFDAVVDTIGKLRGRQDVLADFFPKVGEEDALLGRVTYQEWVEYWPTSSYEPFASHINTVTKYVVSKSLESARWGTKGNATVLKGNLTDAVTSLKKQPGKVIGVHGSPSLVESLMRANVLGLLRLEVYPVIAGSGARLFEKGGAPKRMDLVDSKTIGEGVVILTYRPWKS